MRTDLAERVHCALDGSLRTRGNGHYERLHRLQPMLSVTGSVGVSALGVHSAGTVLPWCQAHERSV